ncbi:MAG: hypothetical protein [Microviridae sp.]|nr:MAG: hypothetical protein [Microviridae sp.]
MARKQRKRRQRRHQNEQFRRQIRQLTYRTLRSSASPNTTVRSRVSNLNKRHFGVTSRITRPTYRQSRRRLTRGRSRGVVMSSTPHTKINTQNSLQAQPSPQARKEHKCIKKPNSKTAGSGSGKYKGQWKPWCK